MSRRRVIQRRPIPPDPKYNSRLVTMIVRRIMCHGKKSVALNIVYDLIEKQKIVLGGSSGINIAGAIKLAKQMGPGKTIVTILCDHGKRYASKIFNKEFLKSKNLPIPNWL